MFILVFICVLVSGDALLIVACMDVVSGVGFMCLCFFGVGDSG